MLKLLSAASLIVGTSDSSTLTVPVFSKAVKVSSRITVPSGKVLPKSMESSSSQENAKVPAASLTSESAPAPGNPEASSEAKVNKLGFQLTLNCSEPKLVNPSTATETVTVSPQFTLAGAVIFSVTEGAVTVISNVQLFPQPSPSINV